MWDYYAETSRDNICADESTVSMTAQIFTDFFELILRSIRAENHNSDIENEIYDMEHLSKRQLGNVQGMANRFLLGGRQANSHACSP